MPALDRYDRTYGALLGLAYGDAIGFPALFHRTHNFPERRREFLWRTNRDSARQRVIRLCLPFTHRLDPKDLEPSPTDDTEYALFTAGALLSADGEPHADTFVTAWRTTILPDADTVLTGFSERAAIDNLRRGLLPPATGTDNAQHYDDSACCRAVAVGLFASGDGDRAADLARLDAQVTNAEDGVYGAQAVAAAVSLLSSGADLVQALAAARAHFPPDSWIAHGDRTARACAAESSGPQDLLLLLSTRLINTVYSYGNAAPETVPAAFVIVEMCGGDLQQAVSLANAIPKAADSLPALVGALCGAIQGTSAVSPIWQAQLNECRGLCLPALRGVRLDETAGKLAQATATQA